MSDTATINMEPLDPVHKDTDGTWWFWNETWSDREGGYETEAIARAKLARYVLYLDGKLPEQQILKELRTPEQIARVAKRRINLIKTG